MKEEMAEGKDEEMPEAEEASPTEDKVAIYLSISIHLSIYLYLSIQSIQVSYLKLTLPFSLCLSIYLFQEEAAPGAVDDFEGSEKEITAMKEHLIFTMKKVFKETEKVFNARVK